MKKAFFTLLALLLALSLVACGGDTTPPTSSSVAGSSSQATAKADVTVMEEAIVAYLSELSDIDSLTLSGGKIEFSPGNEWGFVGDLWQITNPDVEYADFKDSLAEQLTAAGFEETSNLLGPQWTVNAGIQKIGLMLMSTDAEEYSLMMTHAAEDYSQEFVKAQEAIMPKVIPAVSALEVLPENFSISWIGVTQVTCTLSRVDGNWFYSLDWDSVEGNDIEMAYYFAAIMQEDGSYVYYEWDNDSPGIGEPREGFSVYDDIDGLLAEMLDFSGWSDASLSTWVQMSFDFEEGSLFTSTNLRHSITNNMEKTGSEEIAGVECDVVLNDALFLETEYTYDPATGILFRLGSKNPDEAEMNYDFTVTEYIVNPERLGTFPVE